MRQNLTDPADFPPLVTTNARFPNVTALADRYQPMAYEPAPPRTTSER